MEQTSVSILILSFPNIYSFQGWRKLWLTAPQKQPDFLLCLLLKWVFFFFSHQWEVWRLSPSQICLESWPCILLACFSQEKWTNSYLCIISPGNCAFLCIISALGTCVSNLPILLLYQPDHPTGLVRGTLLLNPSPDNSNSNILTMCTPAPPFCSGASISPPLFLLHFPFLLLHCRLCIPIQKCYCFS